MAEWSRSKHLPLTIYLLSPTYTLWVDFHNFTNIKIFYMSWRRFNGERITEDILDAVRSTVEREVADGYRLKVCIGTDSQVRGTVTEFATVIVFLREKKGGFMYIRNEKSEKQFSLRERM